MTQYSRAFAVVAILLSGCSGGASSPPHNTPTGPRTAATPVDGEVHRPGDRVVAYHVVGADTGPLIVYLHGSPSCRLDIDYIAERSRKRGVRVVGFDRPGWGRSTYTRYDLASVADDALAVADALGAKQFAVVGQSSGSAYAWAVAALHPDRVTAVAVAGGGVPYEEGTPRWNKLSDDDKKALSLIGKDDDEAARLLSKDDEPYMQMLALSDAEILGGWKQSSGPADNRTIDAGLGPFLVKSTRESLRQGHVGWARENVVRMGPWPIEMAKIKCPATQWYGEQDHRVKELADWVTAHLPSVVTRIAPDRGHFVAFDDWEQMLDFLLQTGKTAAR